MLLVLQFLMNCDSLINFKFIFVKLYRSWEKQFKSLWRHNVKSMSCAGTHGLGQRKTQLGILNGMQNQEINLENWKTFLLNAGAILIGLSRCHSCIQFLFVFTSMTWSLVQEVSNYEVANSALPSVSCGLAESPRLSNTTAFGRSPKHWKTLGNMCGQFKVSCCLWVKYYFQNDSL